MFTKAYVLSQPELGMLIEEIREYWRETKIEEPHIKLEDFLIDWFERWLDAGDVDMVMIYDGKKWNEISTGEEFCEFIKDKVSD